MTATLPNMNTLSETVKLACDLISRPSITPLDEGCQQLIADRLIPLGFTIEFLRFGEVDNLFARRGNATPLVVFAGHTDVVPPGPLEGWKSPPFIPTLREDYLFGRGSADMKGGIAAMITACEQFLVMHPHFPGSIAFLITSDEEGPAKDGTQKVLAELQSRGIQIDYCLVGEPSSETQLGDMMKVGRRGSLSGYLKIFGEQGHIAYAKPEENPIHLAFPALSRLTDMVWDEIPLIAPDFPKTSFHIANLHAGTHAGNVVPGILECQFNFRFSPNTTPDKLKQRVEKILQDHHLRYELHWELFGLPFLTGPGKLIEATTKAIQQVLNRTPESSTSGGTSDARFIARTGAEVIEFGLCRKSIHALNECVKVSDLDKLSQIYLQILLNLFSL